MNLNFKGVRSAEMTDDGYVIFSGQIVLAFGDNAPALKQEVFFNPDSGFTIQGKPLSSMYTPELISQPSIIAKIIGNFKLIVFNLTGKYIGNGKSKTKEN